MKIVIHNQTTEADIEGEETQIPNLVTQNGPCASSFMITRIFDNVPVYIAGSIEFLDDSKRLIVFGRLQTGLIIHYLPILILHPRQLGLI